MGRYYELPEPKELEWYLFGQISVVLIHDNIVVIDYTGLTRLAESGIFILHLDFLQYCFSFSNYCRQEYNGTLLNKDGLIQVAKWLQYFLDDDDEVWVDAKRNARYNAGYFFLINNGDYWVLLTFLKDSSEFMDNPLEMSPWL